MKKETDRLRGKMDVKFTVSLWDYGRRTGNPVSKKADLCYTYA